MSVPRILTVLALAAAAVVPASAPAYAGMPPDGAAIRGFKALGSGCTDASTTFDHNGSVLGFTAKFDPVVFTAQAGGNSRPTDSRKNCQLLVDVTIPAGYTVAVTEADVHGYASLPAGGSSELRYAIGWGTSTTRPWSEPDVRSGPYEDYWSAYHPLSQPSYAPCGGTLPLVISLDLRARSGTDRRQLAWTALENPRLPSTLFLLNWEPCA